jgi:hypothetical protein
MDSWLYRPTQSRRDCPEAVQVRAASHLCHEKTIPVYFSQPLVGRGPCDGHMVPHARAVHNADRGVEEMCATLPPLLCPKVCATPSVSNPLRRIEPKTTHSYTHAECINYSTLNRLSSISHTVQVLYPNTHPLTRVCSNWTPQMLCRTQCRKAQNNHNEQMIGILFTTSSYIHWGRGRGEETDREKRERRAQRFTRQHPSTMKRSIGRKRGRATLGGRRAPGIGNRLHQFTYTDAGKSDPVGWGWAQASPFISFDTIK